MAYADSNLVKQYNSPLKIPYLIHHTLQQSHCNQLSPKLLKKGDCSGLEIPIPRNGILLFF